MMKTMKRLGAMLLALVLTLALAAPAFAAEGETAPTATGTGTITIKKANDKVNTSVYDAYQIVSWEKTETDGVFGYAKMTITSDAYREVLRTAAKLGAAATDSQILKVISGLAGDNGPDMNASEIADLAVALAKVKADPTVQNNKGGEFTVPYGYYLIIETANNAEDGTVASRPILVAVPNATGDDVSITVKTSQADIGKIIVKDGDDVQADQVKIGDKVNFMLTPDVPKYVADAINIKYFITDTLSKGLTLDKTSVKVEGLTDGADYAVVIGDNADGTTTLQIHFNYDSIKALDKLTVTYSATLNEKANIGINGNDNSVVLSYTNNPQTGTSSDPFTPPTVPVDPEEPTDPEEPPYNVTDDKHTAVYTTGIKLTKVDDMEKKLAGAEFGIYSNAGCAEDTLVGHYTYKVDADGNVTVEIIKGDGKVVTGPDGIAYFTGLIAGTYYIKETKAPDGYDLPKDPLTVTIGVELPKEIITGEELATWTTSSAGFSADADGLIIGNVVNTAGFTLPGTGGMGTTLFTVAGVSLIVVAGALLLIYNKKNRA